jgi:hypothetical protein
MAGQTTDERIEALAAAITAQNRTLAMMLGTQKLHNEMLAKVLEAVTRTPDDDDALSGVLGEIVKQVGEIHERVYLE